MVTDPVCKMSLAPEDAAATAEFAGATFYFCSSSCHGKFLAAPASYVGDGASAADVTPGAPSHPRPDQAAHVRLDRGLIVRAGSYGAAAMAALLAIYFAVLTLVSGWAFTVDQFGQFWPYIVALAFGFGVQIALYTYLRRALHSMHASGKIVAVSGTTSGAAMVSCCTHYLVNLVPALGATGLVTLVGQYQVQLFWVGLAANLAGIAYVGQRVRQFAKGV